MLKGIGQLRGMSPWILMDFRSPRRPLPGIQDYFNRKGLISDQGEKKEAFYILQKAYKEGTIGHAGRDWDEIEKKRLTTDYIAKRRRAHSLCRAKSSIGVSPVPLCLWNDSSASDGLRKVWLSSF